MTARPDWVSGAKAVNEATDFDIGPDLTAIRGAAERAWRARASAIQAIGRRLSQGPLRAARPTQSTRGGPIKPEALAGIDLRLPVERDMSASLATSPWAIRASVGRPRSTIRAGAGARTTAPPHERQP
jgi:hypothetical protein